MLSFLLQTSGRPPLDMSGAITAEDLEASFLTDPDNSLSGGDSDGESRPRRPPGFEAPRVIQPPHLVHQQLLQRHILEQNNLRQRQLSGDVLGIQGLANLGLQDPQGPLVHPPFAPGPFGPMLLPYRLPPHLPHQPGDGPTPVWPSMGPVLFPGDLRHPLLHPAAMEQFLGAGRAPPSSGNPLPIPSGQPRTPDPVVAEGSPMTPPNLHSFIYED